MNGIESITLPSPDRKGGMPLTEAINRRRSIREFGNEPVTQFQLSQVLWVTQGITENRWQLRTVPSAGATFPLEIYVVCGENGVEGLTAGVYHYDVNNHALILHFGGDVRTPLAEAALGQTAISEAPASIVICADYRRTTGRYGDRGERYVHMEVGHASQNIYLQATALGLGTFAIGAFYDEQVGEVLRLNKQYQPLYIMPVGNSA